MQCDIIFSERMLEQNSSRRQVYVVAGLVSVLLIGAGTGLVFYYGKTYTNVKHIRVAGNVMLSASEVLTAAGIDLARPFTRGDLYSAQNRLLSHPAVASATLQEEGEEVIIRIRERACLAVLRVDGSMIDVDETGRILFYDGRCSASPLVSGAFRIQDNRVHGEGMADVLSALRALRDGRPDLENRVSEIHLRKGYYTIYVVRPAIQIDVPDLSQENIERITASLAFFEKEGQRRGRIDLRGKNALYLPKT